MVVTTGGTGRGEKDLMSAAITALEGELFFHGVNMSPGKQTLFARVDKTLVFGLPGRPVATYLGTLSFLFSRLTFGPRGPVVEALRSAKKGIMAEMLRSNGLMRVEPGRELLKPGDEVRVQLIDLGLEGLSYFD